MKPLTIADVRDAVGLPEKVGEVDLTSFEIDLNQPDLNVVALTAGQTVNGMQIIETRNYTIAELRGMASVAAMRHKFPL